MEITNGLLVGERRKRRTIAQVTSVLQRIADLPIFAESLGVDRVFGAILVIARQEQLTIYDTAYLELALRLLLPIATLDEKLKRAADHAGIQSLQL
jgi:predicted nucleic acid-binding protein